MARFRRTSCERLSNGIPPLSHRTATFSKAHRENRSAGNTEPDFTEKEASTMTKKKVDTPEFGGGTKKTKKGASKSVKKR